jgi:hypothetical protein
MNGRCPDRREGITEDEELENGEGALDRYMR